MVFSSLPFLYIFLPAVLLTYFSVPRRFRNAVLLISSLLFYFFGEQLFVLLLIISSISDFIFSLLIEKYRERPRLAKTFMLAAVVISLSMLGFFKYIDFFIGIANSVFGTSIDYIGSHLPLGISFFSFQTMSYTIDVYRGRAKAQRNLTTMATYICLFPQLVAGPIVRYTDINEKLEDRNRESLDLVVVGIRRFCIGLLKKVLIANTMGELVEIFRDSDERTVLFFWLYAGAFMMQLYFDFSGYSDMAIGLGKMFGFHFPENFNYPYISRSVAEFWRRWHMTLGTFFRDYVYIPMGGNRVGRLRWLFNIAVVWALTGFWHGADWNFILWGAMMAAFLMLEKFVLSKFLTRARIFSHVYTMFIILVSLVLFNGQGLAGSLADVAGLFGGAGQGLVGPESLYYLRSFAPLFAISIFACTPLLKRCGDKLLEKKSHITWLEPAMIVIILLLITAHLVDGSFNPFIYFWF